ncbi:MAG: cyclic nucleotide-binding domain-containing protein [Verrucomicrobia bacterium]|nr:cyclic nucleotide-binding domain-containing protein [Verrucomicrobiota bacterium]
MADSKPNPATAPSAVAARPPPPPPQPQPGLPPSSHSTVADSVLVPPTAPVSRPTVPPTDDFFAFCNKINPQQFQKIIQSGQLVQHGKDSVVCRQGDPSDAFYVINDGIVEVIVAGVEKCKPVLMTYLSKGDLFGEVGLLADDLRTATVRVPKSATLLKYSKDAFLQLIATVPAFSHYLVTVLARRLHKTTTRFHFCSHAREFSGSLDFFDLPTIFQTIALSQQHGVMHVFNLTSEILGEFAFANGKPITARFRHLYGLEALLDLFQVTPRAIFGFARTNEPPIVVSPFSISDVNEFAIHAVDLRDKMLDLQKKLDIPEDKPIKRIHASLAWTDNELKDCAEALWKLWQKEKKPLLLKECLNNVAYCHYHILKVLGKLFETRQVAYAELTPHGFR